MNLFFIRYFNLNRSIGSLTEISSRLCDSNFLPFNLFSAYLIVLFLDVIGVTTQPGRVISQSNYRLLEIEIFDEK